MRAFVAKTKTSARRKKRAPDFSLSPAHTHLSLRFPKGFLWGTATAAHQVEGGNTKNDWALWERLPGKVAGGDRAGRATDHYHRYALDFDLAASQHMNAHRFSLEWSRIEPRDGEWDAKEIAHYRAVLEALRVRGQQTMVTLFHFTVPQWFAARGGWAAKDAVGYFLRFATKAADAFGDLVDFWCTQNEPLVYVVMGYILGTWPPGIKNYRTAWTVFHNLTAGHVAATHGLHERARMLGRAVPVGVANNLISFYSYRKHSPLDAVSLTLSDWVWNHAYYRETRGSHDYLGVNYYFHQRIKREEGKLVQLFVDLRAENREMSDIGWEVYPAGIFDVLQELGEQHLPIYITENGIATVNDDRRIRFLVAYLKEVYHAIQSGIDIRGYFHWSLLDNFEWEKGYAARFGLIDVDWRTLQRRPKKSFSVYGRIAAENALSHDILRYVGHGVL
jgi:beta-glucosidase